MFSLTFSFYFLFTGLSTIESRDAPSGQVLIWSEFANYDDALGQGEHFTTIGKGGNLNVLTEFEGLNSEEPFKGDGKSGNMMETVQVLEVRTNGLCPLNWNILKKCMLKGLQPLIDYSKKTIASKGKSKSKKKPQPKLRSQMRPAGPPRPPRVSQEQSNSAPSSSASPPHRTLEIQGHSNSDLAILVSASPEPQPVVSQVPTKPGSPRSGGSPRRSPERSNSDPSVSADAPPQTLVSQVHTNPVSPRSGGSPRRSPVNQRPIKPAPPSSAGSPPPPLVKQGSSMSSSSRFAGLPPRLSMRQGSSIRPYDPPPIPKKLLEKKPLTSNDLLPYSARFKFNFQDSRF